MAIINTLHKCLDSPYLFPDEDAPGRVPGLLALAAERLDAAGRVQRSGQADQTDAGLFAYEAMFADLRALVYARGYREAGLRCLLLACEQLYVRADLLDAEHLRAFERAQSLKLEPAQVVEAAAAFDRKARELLTL
ncbi:hypothetical protein TA3x_004880 [Tundrisphaera sp. TA3]|uniref:hypothetical protein n=1 Tax=Tundrisphaera sp. TA3 TaxID=3435775 RepID=UPI003EBA2B56